MIKQSLLLGFIVSIFFARYIDLIPTTSQKVEEPIIEQPAEAEPDQQVEPPVETTETEPPLDPILDNPSNCDLDVQYVWEDFSCHDKPVPKKRAKPVSSGLTASCEAYRHLVAQYDWNVETMMYAMKKESSCNPLAVGDNYPIRGLHAPSCGLFQIRTLRGRPTCEQLKDPVTNVDWAYRVWRGQGYLAWSVLR